MCVCLNESVCITYVQVPVEARKRVLEPLELQLHMVMSDLSRF